MNHELESAVEAFIFRMKLSDDAERKEAFEKLFKELCHHCGAHDPSGRCQCWNDE